MIPRDAAILVVGAGASGLVTVNALRSEGFTNVTVFERRSDVGGVWLFDEDLQDDAERYPSPMYDRLIGNIWYKLLELESHKFPDGIQNFPSRQEMQTYLQVYAKDHRAFIKICRNVLTINKVGDDWHVESMDTRPDGQHYTDTYKAVVMACGIYDFPDDPQIPGLAQWRKERPEQVIHSKYYRTPEPFRGKRILIMGNGPSGIDCASQCADVAKTPCYRTINGPAEHAVLPDDRIIDLPAVAELDVHAQSATLIDGQSLTGIDQIIISTGYRHSYPALRSLDRTDYPLITNGARVHNLYKHIFYLPDPTLCFVGLLIAAIPLPISEAQALTVARVFSGRLHLPDRNTMKKDEQSRLAQVGDTYKFHKMRYPLDADYGDMLRNWCLEASPAKANEQLPVQWNEERRLWRRMNLDLKMEQLREYRRLHSKN